MDDDEVKEKFTCRDPFHDNVYWPAVPQGFLVNFLRSCAEHGISATLDMHTYSGGDADRNVLGRVSTVLSILDPRRRPGHGRQRGGWAYYRQRREDVIARFHRLA